MREKDIKIIDKLLDDTREPLVNILLYAQVGMEHMRDQSISINHMTRVKMDDNVIDCLKKAMGEMNAE